MRCHDFVGIAGGFAGPEEMAPRDFATVPRNSFATVHRGGGSALRRTSIDLGADVGGTTSVDGER